MLLLLLHSSSFSLDQLPLFQELLLFPFPTASLVPLPELGICLPFLFLVIY